MKKQVLICQLMRTFFTFSVVSKIQKVFPRQGSMYRAPYSVGVKCPSMNAYHISLHTKQFLQTKPETPPNSWPPCVLFSETAFGN